MILVIFCKRYQLPTGIYMKFQNAFPRSFFHSLMFFLVSVVFSTMPLYAQAAWAKVETGSTGVFLSMAWSGSRFVMVGQGEVLTSEDGLSWNSQTDRKDQLTDVIWADSQFIAVGATGSALTSPDGKLWTTQDAGELNHRALAWSGDRVMAVGEKGEVQVSSDGRVWAPHIIDSRLSLKDVVWTGKSWVAVGCIPGKSGTQDTGVIVSSTNGIAWERHPLDGVPPAMHVIAWNGKELIATGGPIWGESKIPVYHSLDGKEWSTSMIQFQLYLDIYALSWTGNQWIAAGGDQSINSTTIVIQNGAEWKPMKFTNRHALNCLLVAGDRIFAAGYQGTLLSFNVADLVPPVSLIRQKNGLQKAASHSSPLSVMPGKAVYSAAGRQLVPRKNVR